MLKPVPLLSVTFEPPSVALILNSVLEGILVTQYLTPLVTPFAVLLGVNESPTPKPCADPVTKVSVPVMLVTVIFGAAVLPPLMML